MQAYREVFQYIEKYKLSDSTACIFVHCFDQYISLYIDVAIMNCGNKLSVYALICLRIIMKYNDDQDRLFADTIEVERHGPKQKICAYQDIYDTISRKILKL